MRLLWKVEWLKFVRQRENLWVLSILILLLTISAIWSTQAAKIIRTDQTTQLELRNATVSNANVSSPEEAPSLSAAKLAFNLNRSNSGVVGLTQLPPLAGLVLNVSRFQQLDTDIRVSVESRFVNGRTSESFTNPALAELGTLDFSTIVIFFLPLAVIVLCAGLVQEDKDAGTWRIVCAQTVSPWKSLYIAYGMRFILLSGITVVISSIAILTDSITAGGTALLWSALIVAYCAWWVIFCALIGFLRVASGTAIMVALGSWLLLTIITPALLEVIANKTNESPSRLENIVDMRAIQLRTEENTSALLDSWYEAHPDARPASIATHSWPITFLPRFKALDKSLRPMMFEFETQQALKEQWFLTHSWFSPALTMLSIADGLSGVNANRYKNYVSEVNTFELQWRSFVTPKIMSYQGINSQDLNNLPRFKASSYLRQNYHIDRNLVFTLLVEILAGLVLLFIFRKNFRVL